MENNDGMKKSLGSRHMSMIALGGVIGAGLFVGSGTAIHTVGPGALLSYMISGALVIMLMRMLGEMASANPTSGSFSDYATEAIGPWAGFTVGWLYWFQWVVVIALEAIAGASIIQSWIPVLPIWVITLLLTLLLTVTNIVSVKSFGEFEYWFAMIKVVSIILFLCLGAYFIFGISPDSSGGFSNLIQHGGFFPAGVGAIFLGVVNVIFSFTGTEVTTIAAAESKNPVKSISRAINSTVWRVIIFYIGSIAVVVTLLPWNSASILESPFVAVLKETHIPFAGQIMNIVVLTAVLSCLNSGLYTTSRMLFSLAKKGDAPKPFLKLNKKGVPALAVIAATIISYVSVIMNFVSPEVVFYFLVNASGAIILLVYLIIAFSQLKMRKQLEAQNPEQLKMKMWFYPYLTYVTIACIIVVLVGMAFIKSTQSQLFLTLSLAAVIVIFSVVVSSKKKNVRKYSTKTELKSTSET